MHRFTRVMPAAVLLVAATTACSRQRPQAAPTPQPVATNDADAERARREAADREAARRAEEARSRAAREAAEREAERAALTATVYFDYDASELDDAARAALDAKVPLLQRNPAVTLRVAGHTDDRGSDEYNLALAQRRAVNVRRYLAAHQVDPSRLTVVGLGEERPVCAEEGEPCWGRNRRAEFEIVAGAVASRLPDER